MLVQQLEHHDTLENAEDALSGIRELPFFVVGYIIQTPTKITLVSIMSCADGALCRGQRLVTMVTANDTGLIHS